MAVERARLLLVDDEPSIRETVSRYLGHLGFSVRTAETGVQALRAAAELLPELVLLDVMLPDADGFELLGRLRADGLAVPVVFLTARDTRADIIRGLREGGDDYITKPFDIDVVVARITAVLRRTRPADVLPQRPPLRYGDLELDETTYSVHRADRSVELTPTEYALLRFLVRNGGRIVPKEQLLRHVWQYEHTPPESTVVETYISYLRRKLETLGAPVITTRRGVGYGLA